jgi:hypothetical protein
MGLLHCTKYSCWDLPSLGGFKAFHVFVHIWTLSYDFLCISSMNITLGGQSIHHDSIISSDASRLRQIVVNHDCVTNFLGKSCVQQFTHQFSKKCPTHFQCHRCTASVTIHTRDRGEPWARSAPGADVSVLLGYNHAEITPRSWDPRSWDITPITMVCPLISIAELPHRPWWTFGFMECNQQTWDTMVKYGGKKSRNDGYDKSGESVVSSPQ